MLVLVGAGACSNDADDDADSKPEFYRRPLPTATPTATTLPSTISGDVVPKPQRVRMLTRVQQFVIASRRGDCDAAWAMGNHTLHATGGPKEVFCQHLMPSVACMDFSRATVETPLPNRLEVSWGAVYTIIVIDGASSPARITNAVVPTV